MPWVEQNDAKRDGSLTSEMEHSQGKEKQETKLSTNILYVNNIMYSAHHVKIFFCFVFIEGLMVLVPLQLMRKLGLRR